MIGFTGSIGNDLEQKFIKDTYNCIFFKIPAFLNCCTDKENNRDYSKKDVLLINEGFNIENSKQEQYDKIKEIALKYCVKVPVLIIMPDEEDLPALQRKFGICSNLRLINYEVY